MYEDADLDAGVKAGLLTDDNATALRNLAATRRGEPLADAERFGSIDGLSDVMTALAVLLTLGCGGVLIMTTLGMGFAFVPVILVLGCAEMFTRSRRMTLTSFVLFAMFVVFWACFCLAAAFVLAGEPIAITGSSLEPQARLVTAAGLSAGCGLFWWRFGLPIAYAGAVVAGINVLIHMLRIVFPAVPASLVGAILLGLGVFLFLLAMWWDISDVRRETRRSDIAFWLHVAAGFQVANGCYRLIVGVGGLPQGWDRLYAFGIAGFNAVSALAVLAVSLLFCAVALAVDRRSLLMSSLPFVVPAIAHLLGGGAAWVVGLMIVGLALLFLSARWTALRRRVLERLPLSVRAQLPRGEIAVRGPRPVR